MPTFVGSIQEGREPPVPDARHAVTSPPSLLRNPAVADPGTIG